MRSYGEKPTKRELRFALLEGMPSQIFSVCYVCGQTGEITNETPCISCGFPQGERQMSQPAMPVSLLEWRPLKRGKLRGHATVRLGAMKIADVAVFSGDGKRWAALPQKVKIRDGQIARDADGKIEYAPVVQWAERSASDRFSEGVILAVEAAHPHDTDADV